MERRIEFHEILCTLLGTRHVYFQPPESLKLVYPCIVYKLSEIDQKHADDISYLNTRGYTVTLIDRNPDSAFIDKILALPLCRYVNHICVDGINNDTFKIYY